MEGKINEKIIDLRNQIDLKVESMKIEIDIERDRLFNKLNDMEKKLNK